MSQQLSLNVSGMKCGGCEANATTKLTAVAGVLSVTANYKENKIEIEIDADKTNLSAITKVITDAGYQVH